MVPMTEPLGIIAGGGRLPVLLAQRAAHHRPVVVVSIAEKIQPELVASAARLERVPVGQIASILAVFDESGTKELAIIGSVRKDVVFRPTQLDWLALKILAQTRARGDQAILAAIGDEFARRGFVIADQRYHLGDIVPNAGPVTSRRIGKRAAEAAASAMALARSVADLDIGQTVVVKDGIPVAIEAIEGTDAAIRRGAELGGEGVVVAKAARPEHDFRFDVPTIGADTIHVLIEAHASMIVVEAGRTFLLDREECVRQADQAGLRIMAL